MLRTFGHAMAVACLGFGACAQAGAASCTDLRAIKLPRGAVTLVEETRQLPGTALEAPICRIAGIVKPTARSDIRFEVWIPTGGAWNGKYLQLGNGGFAGRIPYQGANGYLARGYAVGVTDDGHTSTDFTDARWALAAPDKIRDYAFRGIKSTHDAALAVLRRYVGHAPAKSYFVGCSNGGREALQAAQMFPRDFDGIVAGAPATHVTSLLAAMGLTAQHLAEPGNQLPPEKLPAIQRAALAACAGTKRYVVDIEHCRFDPDVLACSAAETEASPAECLTPTELATVRKIYAGFRDLSTGESLRGPTPGAEAQPGGWQGWILGRGSDEPSGIEEFARNFYAYFVRGEPEFSISQLRAQDVEAGHVRFGALLDADNPDLTQFKARGGKLIQYHGGNDPGIPVVYSTSYFRKVQARMGDTEAFYRLFLVPGMLHCGGGAAPSEVDWLGALEAWAEQGTAPDDLTAHWPSAGAVPADSDKEQRLSRYRTP